MNDPPIKCPNCETMVNDGQFFGDCCAFCFAAYSRGVKGVRSNMMIKNGSVKQC